MVLWAEIVDRMQPDPVLRAGNGAEDALRFLSAIDRVEVPSFHLPQSLLQSAVQEGSATPADPVDCAGLYPGARARLENYCRRHHHKLSSIA